MCTYVYVCVRVSAFVQLTKYSGGAILNFKQWSLQFSLLLGRHGTPQLSENVTEGRSLVWIIKMALRYQRRQHKWTVRRAGGQEREVENNGEQKHFSSPPYRTYTYTRIEWTIEKPSLWTLI